MEAGLDAVEVQQVLASEEFASDVRADEREAQGLGIRGVPFFLIDGRLASSGAQRVEAFLQALQAAREEPQKA